MKCFYRLILTGVLLFTLSCSLLAQVPLLVSGTKEVDTTFAHKMNHVFEHLDKSKVPYGILRDYGMEFTNLENYSGSVSLADSNYANSGSFWQVYNTLVMSRISISASGFIRPDTLGNRWFRYRQPGRITLAGLYFRYARFKDNAANNYVTVSNGQLYDKYVNGVWQNPYQSEQVFLISPSVEVYQGKSFNLLLPADLWLTNNSAGISSISVDVGDGGGYHTLTPGTALPVSYADTGRKEWTYKLTLTGGTSLYAHSTVRIENTVIDQGGSYSIARFGASNPEVIPITATDSYLGKAASGTMTIIYADADWGLRRPLIVAEGYDPGHILKPEDRFGITNIHTFRRSIFNSLSPDLINLLVNNPQFDVIYVDWNDGTDYLERNALLLESVINWVNANKEPLPGGGFATNVVLGQSMGGVIARYALRDMENKGEDHDTRLFVSHDAPMQGANVPEGFQHMARHARSLYIKTGLSAGIIETIRFLQGKSSYFLTLSLANTPASREMLVNYVDDDNNIDNTVHSAWQTKLHNIGYPQGVSGVPFRMVAISNGSECGTTEPFAAGGNLLTFQGKANTRFIGDLAGMVAFPLASVALGQLPFLLGILPGRNDFHFNLIVNSKADGVSNLVYKGKITYTKKILWLINVNTTVTNRNYYSNASTLPYDYFPGGFYDLVNGAGLNLQDASLQNVFFRYNITAHNAPTFCFVPTCSALDIGEGDVNLTETDYLRSYVGANPPSAPKNTPFDNFITAFNDNGNDESHISFELRNGDWLAEELNGNNPAADCSAFCSSTQISGDDNICTSGTYSIPITVDGSTTIIWTASPSGIVSLTPNGNQVTVTRISNGVLTLTANITTASCGNFSVPKSITAGPQKPGQINGFLDYIMGRIKANVYPVPDATSYNWYLGNTLQSSHGRSATIPTWKRNDCNSFYDVSVEAVSVCGTSDKSYRRFYAPPCGGPYVIAPNPANTQVSISSDISYEDKKLSSQSASGNIKSVKVLNLSGKLLKQFQYPSGTTRVNIDVSSLPAGAYLFSIYNGTEWFTQKVVIGR